MYIPDLCYYNNLIKRKSLPIKILLIKLKKNLNDLKLT